MRILIVAILLSLSTACAAADRSAKIRSLMEAQGLLGMLEQQMSLGRQQARRQADQLLDQMMGAAKPPPEAIPRLRKASEEFMAALQSPWTAQEIVDVWAGVYGAAFSDEELDQLIAFYLSPLGQKDVRASQEALPKLSQHFDERLRPILENATRKYMSDIQQIAKELRK